ncbi:MAG: hypothetical protein PHU12_03980 [Candidatus Aenigmarchaeota archaeon]|nr:hypothetical protein [Candidatus Aenigmarchaeota archaeon]
MELVFAGSLKKRSVDIVDEDGVIQKGVELYFPKESSFHNQERRYCVMTTEQASQNNFVDSVESEDGPDYAFKIGGIMFGCRDRKK